MDDIRFSTNLAYTVESPGYVSVVRNENFVFSYKEGKKSFSFIFVQRGEMEYYFQDSKRRIRILKDEALFVPKNYPYKTTYKKDNTKIQIVTFDIKDPNDSLFHSPICLKTPEIPLIFSSISAVNMSNSLFLSAKIYELLYYLEEKNVVLPKKYTALLPALKEFTTLYFKNEKIGYYAKLCEMSESNFRKLFKEYTGKSPIEYRNLIRISHVKRFLNSGEFTLSEAADLAGFNNKAFFYEVYNKYAK